MSHDNPCSPRPRTGASARPGITLTALLAVLLAATPAFAGNWTTDTGETVEVDGDHVVFMAADGEAGEVQNGESRFVVRSADGATWTTEDGETIELPEGGKFFFRGEGDGPLYVGGAGNSWTTQDGEQIELPEGAKFFVRGEGGGPAYIGGEGDGEVAWQVYTAGDGKEVRDYQVHSVGGEGENGPRIRYFRMPEGDNGLLFEQMHLGRGYLGVELTELTPELRKHFGAPEDAGVLVARVVEDSPAAAAGIRVGDIITSVEGEQVGSTMALSSRVRGLEEGQEALVQLYRDGSLLDFAVTVGARERTRVDVGRYFNWRFDHGGSEPGEHPMELHFQGDDGEAIEIKPRIRFNYQNMEQLGEELEKIDWSDFSNTFLHERDPEEVQEKIRQLEERLKQLEAELEKGGGGS